MITQVHALKSASAALGAAEFSGEAARLEAAGNAGDLSGIRETLPAFVNHLAELAEAIHAALKESAPDSGKSTEPEALSPLLNTLAGALKAQKAEAIDRVLEELTRQPLDSLARESLEKISGDILMTDFDKALETLAALMAADE